MVSIDILICDNNAWRMGYEAWELSKKYTREHHASSPKIINDIQKTMHIEGGFRMANIAIPTSGVRLTREEIGYIAERIRKLYKHNFSW